MPDLRLAWAVARGGRAERREAAWALVRRLLAREGHPDALLSNPCPRCGGPHGPVRVAGAPWRASVSYAGAVAVVGIHPDTVTAFGLDAEPLADPVRDAGGGVDGGLLRWVRTEAVLKADERGLRIDPAELEFTEAGNGWSARISDRTEAFIGWEPDGVPGILVSVALMRGAASSPQRLGADAFGSGGRAR
ncbi:chemotaxis protein CheY [Microbacterium sp.]|uniref:chemotaxis protein CheY n=1 Tax=Microbacterium sp. TaxID=51671 RepID=UPI0025DFA234|nr:chemotaxis protein CheY [Microbacterium sp.]